MPSFSPLVQSHYGQPGLASRLVSALEQAGKNPDALTRDDLAAFEEFHTRGRLATRELADLAGLQPGLHVLDIGSGIGGPARTLAAEFGCRVTGLDIVDAYCEAATMLTDRVGLGGQVRFQQGDALDMPFDDASFDAAIMEHASMNIDDKPALFRQIARVLRDGGRLALYEICAGAEPAPHYPAPWAGDETISFLATARELEDSARAAGFEWLLARDLSSEARDWFRAMLDAAAARPKDTPHPLGLHLLMGPDTAEKVSNLLRNLDEDRVRVVQAVCIRSART